jgi:hypothetical protein
MAWELKSKRSTRLQSRNPARLGCMQRTRGSSRKNRWSQQVTERSNALDLEAGVFKRSPSQIARSLKRSADHSNRRKASPLRSALSMLTFYVNRAGKNLPAARKRVLERAKDELRSLYGQPRKHHATKRRSRRS